MEGGLQVWYEIQGSLAPEPLNSKKSDVAGCAGTHYSAELKKQQTPARKAALYDFVPSSHSIPA
jgi:hypothetical protein